MQIFNPTTNMVNNAIFTRLKFKNKKLDETMDLESEMLKTLFVPMHLVNLPYNHNP